jgi:hypothetical protein
MRGLSFYSLPNEVVDKILQCMVDSRSALAVIKLSMTSHQNRRDIEANLNVWYRLYLYWRGPVRQSRTYRTRNGVVTLRPTFPVTLPNFRTKPPPLT